MASNQCFQHVLQFITKCQTHLGPHPPGRWVLWLVESHTSLMMTGVNSLVQTSNPHLLPKILLQDFTDVCLISHLIWVHWKPQAEIFQLSINVFSKRQRLPTETNTMKTKYKWLLASGFSSMVASLSSFLLFLWGVAGFLRVKQSDMSLGNEAFRNYIVRPSFSGRKCYVHIHVLKFYFTECKVIETKKGQFGNELFLPSCCTIEVCILGASTLSDSCLQQENRVCTFWGHQFIQDDETTLEKNSLHRRGL